MLDTEQRIILLGSQKRLFKNPVPRRIFICRDRFEVEAAMSSPINKATWISFTRDFTDILLKNAVDTRADLRGSHLITLTPPRPRASLRCLASSIRHSAWVRDSTGSPKMNSSSPL